MGWCHFCLRYVSKMSMGLKMCNHFKQYFNVFIFLTDTRTMSSIKHANFPVRERLCSLYELMSLVDKFLNLPQTSSDLVSE